MDFVVLLGFPTQAAVVKVEIHGALLMLVALTDLLLGLVILHQLVYCREIDVVKLVIHLVQAFRARREI